MKALRYELTPKTKAAFIVGEQPCPPIEARMEIGRFMRRYADEPTWGGIQAYTLGFIHGVRQERARRKKGRKV